ncbi:iron chaperone [Nonomuraea sp. NPDC047897]|uniref:iron chaperone n=1 Tax=Nonomuraea sp. NPDC047897 TaxID=3364346 RepID=UPI00371E14E3
MSTTDGSTYEGFTAEERAAMKDHAKELRKAARRSAQADKAAEAARDVLAKISEMRDSDRVMAERVHAVITAAAPALAPRLWYGMPAYARDGKIVCHFQPAEKFKTRHATLGFSDQASLDEGVMWPVAFALTEVTPEVEARIGALVRQAAG